jgi:hypothetical protein
MNDKDTTFKEESANNDEKVQPTIETKSEVKPTRTRTTSAKAPVNATSTRTRLRTTTLAIKNQVKPEANVVELTPSITEIVETTKDSDKEKAKKAKAIEKERK